MAAEGFFHDAHELYARTSETSEWEWMGTLATKDLAEGFGAALQIVAETAGSPFQSEVRPV